MGRRLDSTSMENFVTTIEDIMVSYGYECVHLYDTYPGVEKTYHKEFKDSVINVYTFLHTSGETDLVIFKAPIINEKAEWDDDDESPHHYDLNIEEVERVIGVINRDSVIDSILTDE